jgi:hypothetical protein
MNTANIGWKAYNSFFFPGGVTYEDRAWMPWGTREITPEVAAFLHLQQKFYIATIAGFDPEYTVKYLRDEVSYISYAGAPAFFAASHAAAQIAQWAAGRLPARKEPYVFCFDLQTGAEWDPVAHAIMCGEVMRAASEEGLEAALRVWSELNDNLQQFRIAATPA